MSRRARVHFRKPHIQSAFVDTRVCHCASVLCGLSAVGLLFGSLIYFGRMIGKSNDPQSIIAAVRRDQLYRFNRIGGPLTFQDWTQKSKLVRHCDGNYEVYGDGYAHLHNVILHPSKAKGPIGGEKVDTVLNRPEQDEYLRLSNGLFTLACSSSQRAFANPFARKASPPIRFNMKPQQPERSFLSEFHTALEFVEPEFHALPPHNKHMMNDTVFALTRYEYANFFHTVTYLYNAFLTARSLGLSCDQVHVLFVDAHAHTPLDQVWHTLFRNVTRLKQLPDNTWLRSLVWLPLGYSAPLMNEALRSIPLLTDFSAYFRSRFGLPAQHKTLNCSNVTVTFLFRRNYIAHPRNPTGVVPRRVDNEQQLLDSTRQAFEHAEVKLNLLDVTFEPLSMREQVSLIADTDVLVAMHGAGLTHILFLPEHAAVVEMFSRGTRVSHYEAFARWRSLKYKLFQSKDGNSFVVHVSPVAIVYLIDTLLTEMKCCAHSCLPSSSTFPAS